MALPPITATKYNRSKLGYAGELGEGANARIKFLQTAISKDELDSITLIENIPGSEKWDVRDLFQRDVDADRVNLSILPYLKDRSKVKFFNPLTLVLLPLSDSGGGVDAAVPLIEPERLTEDGHNWISYERDGYYQFRVYDKTPAYSELKWNDKKVKLVAIDGQHRLSALKMWKSQPGAHALDTWHIPVVILGIYRSATSSNTASLLEIVRKTFVYINTRAEEVNEARRILLDDESVTAVSTQEIIQAAHKNDSEPQDLRDPKKLPLLFFDWRGQVKWKKDEDFSAPEAAPGAVKSIEEIHSWLSEYLIPGDEQDEKLELQDLVPPLSDQFREYRVLTHEDAARVRSQWHRLVYPGLMHLLEEFNPYKSYVSKVRELEKAESTDAAGQHAFYKLRFGSHQAPPGALANLVETKFKELIGTLSTIRQASFDELLDRDIGMRAVVYAYSALKAAREELAEAPITWLDHAKWFVPRLNGIYMDGWFKPFTSLEANKRKVLTHVAYDSAGAIINYKLGDVGDALGSLVALLVVHEDLEKFSADDCIRIWELFGEALQGPLRKGLRKEHRSLIRDSFKGTAKQFNEEVNRLAEESLKKKVRTLKKSLLEFD